MFSLNDLPADLSPLTDSRSLTDASHTIFFALRTQTGDGHDYIRELYRQGVRTFVVESTFINANNCNFFTEAHFFETNNPLWLLQQIATNKRQNFSGKVIAITGSRGKTMVKEWLCSLMAPEWNICRSPRSYNSQIGVPLSVWRLSANNTLGVFEAGISRTGEMKTLATIIQPDIAVITNIGDEHDEGFSSREEKINEKLILARNASTIIYPADDADLARIIAATYPDKKLVGWSINDKLDVTLPFSAKWLVENALTVRAIMQEMGYDNQTIETRLQQLRPIGTRLQVSDGVNNCQIIHDDYTCDISSLGIALDFAHRRLTGERKITAILSDLVIEGDNPAETYRKVGELLSCRQVQKVIGIGYAITAMFDKLGIPGKTFHSTDAFLKATTPTDFSSELILVKGTPGFDFQRIVNHLEAKTHETVLEVNLDAMVDNFNFFRSKLKPTTGLVAMVKASGYGAGSLELAKTLQAHGAAYLAVAVGDEGAELRRAGIKMPIMVLNPMVLNYTQLFDNHLEPEIFSFESLNAIIYEARKAGITEFPIHIKLDTGMHRLGFREEELPELFKVLDGAPEVKVKSVFSHLATADCLDQDEYTLSQLEYYKRCSQKIVDHFPHKVLRHVLNTAGILRFPEYQFDMARLGIGLYGIPVLNNGTENALRPISSLRSVIIALRQWNQTETIGYGRRGELHRKSVIATVPIGYADGFNRHCGRGNWKVSVNGRLCPTVGNICMDLCMIDVTDVPDVRIGDSVVIFGPENPATAMAEMLDTIPYECLTSVSPRVRRVYYRES
jgi:alanine racemase